jgi:hypothetical protein
MTKKNRDEMPLWLRVVLFAVGIVAILAAFSGQFGCNKYAVAWRSAAGLQDAGNRTDDALAEAAAKKHNECLVKHGAKADGYAKCVEPYRQVLVAWVTYVRPAISSAIRTTVAALQIAERVKADKTNWLALLKPGACALAKAVADWTHLMGDKAAEQVKKYLGLVEGLACEQGGGK